MKDSAQLDAAKASLQWPWQPWKWNGRLGLQPSALKGHGERSEPSLKRLDDFPRRESVPLLCEVPHCARDDTGVANAAALLQHVLARSRRIRAARSECAPDPYVHLRTDGLQPRAHWKFSRLYLRRFASAPSRIARLQGGSRDEHHRRGR